LVRIVVNKSIMQQHWSVESQ